MGELDTIKEEDREDVLGEEKPSVAEEETLRKEKKENV